MKMVILQLTNASLKLTPINKISGKCIYGPPTTFALPSLLQKGEALNKIPELASFSRDCMCTCGFMQRKSNIQIPKIIFCFDDDRLVSKEYQHMPTKSANLPQIANLEAESVLQSSVRDYIVENYEYNRLDERTGKYKSVLYAVPARIVRDIKREYKRNAMNVCKIVPPINGLINATKMALNLGSYNRDYKNRTFAVVDAGFEKIRLVLFSNNVPIFEKSFEPIYPEVLYTISKERRVPLEEAEKLIYHQGISNCITDSVTSDASRQRINTLFETTFGEIIRTIRVVLSSERLELESIVFSGAFASQPNFDIYVSNLGLETPFANIERVASQANMHIALDKQALQYGCHPADFFCINGVVMSKSEYSIDFLKNLEQQSSNLTATIAVMVVVSVAAVAVMIWPYINLLGAQDQVSQDEQALASPIYVEPLRLEQELAGLQTQLKEADNDKKIMPYQRSVAEDSLSRVLSKLKPQVISITSFAMDSNNANITLVFKAKTYADFVQFRKFVMDDGYFITVVPFTATTDPATKVCTCSVVLGIKNFTSVGVASPKYPASASSTASSSSSSSSSSSKGGSTR